MPRQTSSPRSSGTPLSLSLTWSESSGGDRYNIQRFRQRRGVLPRSPRGISRHQLDGQYRRRQYLLHLPGGRLLHAAAAIPPGPQPSTSVMTIPAAPTGLAATPGTITIGLVWTDPSPTTNITGYHIYRSTDNATWGSVYGTASGATATTFTDNSPGAGTAYYYLVKAYDATGDSATGAGMTCDVATVIAYDGFNYTSGPELQRRQRRRGLLRSLERECARYATPSPT